MIKPPNAIIMHALALLDKSRFDEIERATMVNVIAASSVETLLRPASSTTLKVTRHSIAALAAVQELFEFNA